LGSNVGEGGLTEGTLELETGNLVGPGLLKHVCKLVFGSTIRAGSAVEAGRTGGHAAALALS